MGIVVLPMCLCKRPILEGRTRRIPVSCPSLGRLMTGVFRAVCGTSNIKLTTPRINLSLHLLMVSTSIVKSSFPRYGNFGHTVVGPIFLRGDRRRISVRRNYLDLPKIRRGMTHSTGMHIGCLSRSLGRRRRAIRKFTTHIIRRRYRRLRNRMFVSGVSKVHHRLGGDGLGDVVGNATHYSCGTGTINGWWRLCWLVDVASLDGGVRTLERGGTIIRVNKNRTTVRGRVTVNGLATHSHVLSLLSGGSFRRCSLFIGRSNHSFNVSGGSLPNSNIIANANAVFNTPIYVCTRSFAITNNSLNLRRTHGVAGVVSRTLGVGYPVVNVGSSNNTHVRRNMNTLTNCNRVFCHGAVTSNIVPRVSLVLKPYTNKTMCSPTLASFMFMMRGVSGVFVANPGIVGAILNRSVSVRSLNNTHIRTRAANGTRFCTRDRRRYFRRIGHLIDFVP